MRTFKQLLCVTLCVLLSAGLLACQPSKDKPDDTRVPVSIVKIKGTGVANGKASMFAENTMQLTALISPSNATEKTVVWKSSVPAVASVGTDGLVTGLAEGVTKISATADGKTDQIELSVKKVVAIESMAFAEDEYTVVAQKNAEAKLSLMKELRFTPTDVTYKNVTWSIEALDGADDAHVRVDASGEVTVVQEKPALGARYRVTAAALKDPAKKASTVITIAHETANSVDVRWSHEASSNAAHTYTFPLSYSMYDGLSLVTVPNPSGAMDKFAFTSSDPEVVSIAADKKGDYGIFRIHKTGTAVITVASPITPSLKQEVTINVVADNAVYPLVDAVNRDNSLNLDKATIDALTPSARTAWNFDPEGTAYAADRTASWNDWKNLPVQGFTGVEADRLQMMNSGNGQSIFDAGYGVCLDSWDWPCDNNQTNLYVYNKIKIPADRDLMKVRIRTQAADGLTGRGKFRVRFVDPETYQSTFLKKDGLVGHAWASAVEDREAPDTGVQADQTGWITLDSVPDFTKGLDWFWFDVSAFQGKNVVMILETDDLYYELDEDGDPKFDKCDRIQFIAAYFPETATQDPNDLRSKG